MYLICWIDRDDNLKVVKRCDTAEQITDWFNSMRGTATINLYFVLIATIYPEKR
jgi:hypothetical protein